jgi:hypothetical protein
MTFHIISNITTAVVSSYSIAGLHRTPSAPQIVCLLTALSYRSEQIIEGITSGSSGKSSLKNVRFLTHCLDLSAIKSCNVQLE